MHRYVVHVITVAAVLGIVAADLAFARTGETFTLRDKDVLLVEAAGCHASCGIRTPTWRECSIREAECTAVCMPIETCKPDGVRALQVCAVVKTR